ncbi:acetyl/propionyl-CoA carboxylase subunit alpha [Paeniglutamicibacter antarcticus]|uniref:Biotin-dependent 3-methylcrotonyl-coenzyme A carboxylase alpha1 subunit n=1 Tax=Arthrobacter terrae TaxID=2935737 RepID=A0A931G403_9MICC|nr:biotin carboxylase N-terminal domain-containing protein [Arthrobacter terrae]MBG0739241.1 acetyl/propionyl-CoA carboxylase subunit alpha [Arthrobacter terrae]
MTNLNIPSPADAAVSASAGGSNPAAGTPLFATVLVANRGEIACRVIRTLRLMGIRSVAVYSEADAGARHVREADQAVCIGPAAASESYLSIDAIIAACRATEAQAVHPGYGFLSENPAFAQALEAAGIVFMGPGVEALNVMGDKIRSKNHVVQAGVPVVPGIAEPGLNDGQLIAAAANVGYPLLIKPSAGGGGKGMHVVERAEDLPATLVTARRVAASAFGDDTLFLERLISSPRHIEVQVLADNFGHVIHLGERECSLQRRHQKVVEEAPSPLLDSQHDGAAIRARIGEAACNAARSVAYTGAGTVEFLVSDNAPDEFFFMEMNTRLQVEHPVTEMVTGVDLVQWQVRIAAGEPLTLAQTDVVLSGHAVEARVYAENPERGFMPSIGTVLELDESVTGEPGIRVDSALIRGLEISPNYDPMIAKVIAWGEDRATALDRLDRALSEYVVLGVETNIEYLRMLINDDDVRAGRLDTTLIERKLPALKFRQVSDPEYIAAALLYRQELSSSAAPTSPWALHDGWRLGEDAPWRVVLAGQGPHALVTVTGRGDGSAARVQVNDGPIRQATLQVTLPPAAAAGIPTAQVIVDEEVHRYRLAVTGARTDYRFFEGGWSCSVRVLGREAVTARIRAGIPREGSAADPQVRSPMPGTVVAVIVSNGDSVEAGQTLLAVEAMKMEHQLTASVDGTVHISVKAGDLVRADQVVATIHPAGTADTADTDSEGASSNA